MSEDNFNNAKDSEEEGGFSLESIRKSIEKDVGEFYNGFASSLYFGSEFGTSEEVETAIFKIYKDNAEEIINLLKTSIKDIDSIRSKYIPWELRNDIAKYSQTDNFSRGKNVYNAEDNKFFYESYENAFMRALGMPQSDILVRSGENFLHKLNLNDKETNSEIVLKKILLERETIDIRSHFAREDLLDVTSIFGKKDLTKSLGKKDLEKIFEMTSRYKEELKTRLEGSVADETAPGKDVVEAELALEFLNEVKEEGISATDGDIIFYFEKSILEKPSRGTLVNIFQDINAYSYLLFPPVQNSEISKCISEASSIIKEPFKSDGPRIVNAKEARPSLLETIINIRLDKISGLNYEKVKGVLINKKLYKLSGNVDPKSEAFEASQKEITFDDFTKDKSIVEAMVTNRLFKTLDSTCISLAKEIENFIEKSSRSKAAYAKTVLKYGNGAPKTKDKKPDIKYAKIDYKDERIKQRNLDAYEALKIVNDSILFILTQKEELSRALVNDTKFSSLRGGALFDSILTSISYPGKHIDQKISEINKTANKIANKKNEISESSKKIDELVGLYRGIGVIDVIIFGLAMFLVGEDTLIRLLSIEGYENLKRNKIISSKDFFESFENKTIEEIGSDWSKVQATALMDFSKTASELYLYVKALRFNKK